MEVMEALCGLTESVTNLGNRLDQVYAQLSPATSRLSPQHAAPLPALMDVPPLRQPFIPILARYGELGQCGQLLYQCSLVFDQQTIAYVTDKARVAFVMSLLGGGASQWAEAASRSQSPFCYSFILFSAKLLKIFDQVSKRLLSLKQGANFIADFAVSFRIFAAETGWDEAALQGVFSQGLAENIQDKLATHNDTPSLEELISLAVRLNT